jgi:hypothetical protein
MVVRAASRLWLCTDANWMASSSVIFVGPAGAWPNAEFAAHSQAQAAHAKA